MTKYYSRASDTTVGCKLKMFKELEQEFPFFFLKATSPGVNTQNGNGE